jgi:eukaryotic-like serine/threonine-protein kinase
MNARQDEWPETLIGRLLGDRWTLLKPLGEGGTAAVFEAVHRNGKHVAIKVLKPERANDSRLKQRFLREGYAANRVGHPSVVGIDDDGEESDGTAFLVMELLAGETLDRMTRRLGGTLPWTTTVSMCLELLAVLDAAHERGIVHRDIKPGNLFLTSAGALRVLDFGLARVLDRVVEDQLATGDGALLGTPAFMAPEQARASAASVGPWTDVWAVGATAFTLLTGRRVYEAPDVEGQLALAAAAPAPPLTRFAPEVPAAVAAVFQRALAFDRAQRWPSARAMLEALRAARETLHDSSRPPATDDEVTFLDTVDRPGRRRARARIERRHLAIALPLLGILIALALTWGMRRTESPAAAASIQAQRPSAQPTGRPLEQPTRAVEARRPNPDPAPGPSALRPRVLDMPALTPEKASPRPKSRALEAPAPSARPASPPSSASRWIEEPPF